VIGLCSSQATSIHWKQAISKLDGLSEICPGRSLGSIVDSRDPGRLEGYKGFLVDILEALHNHQVICLVKGLVKVLTYSYINSTFGEVLGARYDVATVGIIWRKNHAIKFCHTLNRRQGGQQSPITLAIFLSYMPDLVGGIPMAPVSAPGEDRAVDDIVGIHIVKVFRIDKDGIGITKECYASLGFIPIVHRN
jgi:hypothetical protein